MAREVLVVLTDADRAVLGELPRFEVASPWWADVEPVVPEVRTRFGAQVHVLRLIDVVGGEPALARGGLVIYEAQLLGGRPTDMRPTGVDVGPDHALRAPWARPGGIQAMVEWADAFVTRTGPAEQVKSWNLSCLLRLPTTLGTVWCKAVPRFFAHEGAVMRRVADVRRDLVPPVVASAPGITLLGHVDGTDQWGAGPDMAMRMVGALVDLQQALTGSGDELCAEELPDWRAPVFLGDVGRLCRRDDVRETLTSEEAVALDLVVEGLPARFAALGECGIESTLVHGDFHPGNWRGGSDTLVLLDWGDSGVGHPLLDMPPFLERMPAGCVPQVRQQWLDLQPGDAERASELIAPIAALRQALIFRTFLDGIEPSERRYHQADVPFWLREAVRGGVELDGRASPGMG